MSAMPAHICSMLAEQCFLHFLFQMRYNNQQVKTKFIKNIGAGNKPS